MKRRGGERSSPLVPEWKGGKESGFGPPCLSLPSGGRSSATGSVEKGGPFQVISAEELSVRAMNNKGFKVLGHQKKEWGRHSEPQRYIPKSDGKFKVRRNKMSGCIQGALKEQCRRIRKARGGSRDSRWGGVNPNPAIYLR